MLTRPDPLPVERDPVLLPQAQDHGVAPKAVLWDVEELLQHAASTGQLTELDSDSVRALVSGIVGARGSATHGDNRTPRIAPDFWLAYARLARLVRPVTSASLTASRRISLAGMKLKALFLVLAVILSSIYLFMGEAILKETNQLIEQQNVAAVALWRDLQTLRTNNPKLATVDHDDDHINALINARVFEETIEFSRRSASLLQAADRLNTWFTWWVRPASVLTPDMESTIPGAQKLRTPSLVGLTVQPDLITNGAEIEREAVTQIKLYQHIRNHALSLAKVGALVFNSLSTYILSIVYALLGAFLYGFRSASDLIHRKEYVPSVAHGTRYFIAAIGGLVVGLFASALPQTTLLPPLLLPFLVGYGVDALFAWLDRLIGKLKADEPVREGQVSP